MRVLILTNLFPTRWDPLRSAFNRQQFERLGRTHTVEVITAVSMVDRLHAASAAMPLIVPGVATDDFVFVYPPRFGRSLHAFFWLLSLWLQKGRRLRRTSADCLLVSWAYPDAVAAGWWARRRGLPYVVKVHGSDLNVQAEHPPLRRQIRRALQGASGVVAVSRALAEKAVAIGADPARVHVIYNGVDSDRFCPGSRHDARARLGLVASDGPLLLFVGNLKASKGCMDMLEAFGSARTRLAGARLLFVGSGPCHTDLLERAVVLGCADAVDVVGAVAHAGLVDWFRASDLLCLPSHNEGVPNVVLEAMACGVPVLATDVGGIPEVVPDYAGILVPPKNVSVLSERMVEAASRTWDTARIASHARGFSWERNIAQLSGVLHAAATSSSPLVDVES